MSADARDDALETLLLPFFDGLLEWPAQGALFLNAREGWPLHRQPLPGLVYEQSFKPEVDALLSRGQQVGADVAADDPARRYPLVLVLPPRQRDQARTLMARAVSLLQPGGIVLACAANEAGAKSFEADLARLAGPLRTLSKNRCRVFWTMPDGADVDAELLAQWRLLDAPRVVADGFTSRPGVFAWDRIDAATALLAQHLPADLAGEAADLGAGTGVLSLALLQRAPGIRHLDLYEADARALDLARINVAPRDGCTIGFHWHDVTGGLARTYDVIVTNPPFHANVRADRPDIGRRFIAVAAEALKPGGRLWLVANRHLPYESVLDRSFGQVRCVVQEGGFKVVEAIRSTGAAPAAPTPVRRARVEPRWRP